jgi:uroporphyrinogen decarboxylase
MNDTITPRDRMLAAYRGVKLDRPPVAPEFWYYIPARLLGMNMIEIHRDLPHWKALQKTFRHYDCEGWGIVSPTPPPGPYPTHTDRRTLPDGQTEVRNVTSTPEGDLVSRRRLDPRNPPWTLERPIKDFPRHWGVYEPMALPDSESYDWSRVQRALDEVGTDYLLEVFVSNPFTDFVGAPREGGFSRMVLDLMEHEDFLRGLRERFVEQCCRLIREALTRTSARSVFVGCSWSCASLIGPKLWREWDRPDLQKFTETAHAAVGLIHVHCHGDCAALIPDFAEMGIDCLCPLERPPGGDVTPDAMARIREQTAGRVTLNGNVHTVETLIRGTPGEVAAEVRQIIDAWGGTGRLIVGTGDQVGIETPDENIRAMIQTVKSYGAWHDAEQNRR